MHYSFAAAALAASATLILAAPASGPPTHTFRVNQEPKGQVFKSGPVQVLKTFQKYASSHGAEAPDNVKAAAAAAQSGSVAASPQQFDQAYLCPVNVGGTTLQLDFDTGSSDLWVFSNQMPSSETAGHAIYAPASNKKLNGYSWRIGYGDGSGASGTVYADKVVVGGVTATSQAVEAATSVSAEFSEDEENDGLLGLAFSSINTVQPKQQTTFFDSVKSTLAKPLFTVDLKHATAGSYDFGYIDANKYTGSIAYTPVDSSDGFWGFTASGFSTGNAAVSGSIGNSILDTGTSLVYLPSNVVSSYYSKVPSARNDASQGGYIFPCSTTLPNFHVAIGGKTFTIPGSYINYAPVDNTGRTCFGGIQPNSGIGVTIFGDVFLKAVFVVFDQTTSTPRIGVAAQK